MPASLTYIHTYIVYTACSLATSAASLSLSLSVHNSARATIFVENNLPQKKRDKERSAGIETEKKKKRKKNCSLCAYATHVATTAAATTGALQQSDNHAHNHAINMWQLSMKFITIHEM